MVRNQGLVSVIPQRGNLATELVRFVIKCHLVKKTQEKENENSPSSQSVDWEKNREKSGTETRDRHLRFAAHHHYFKAHSLWIHFTLASSLFNNAILWCIFCWIRTWSRCTHLFAHVIWCWDVEIGLRVIDSKKGRCMRRRCLR